LRKSLGRSAKTLFIGSNPIDASKKLVFVKNSRFSVFKAFLNFPGFFTFLLNLAEILSVIFLGVFVLEMEQVCIYQGIKTGTIMCTIWMELRRGMVSLSKYFLVTKKYKVDYS